MQRYPESRDVRLNLFDYITTVPEGAFVSDGKIIPAWHCTNTRMRAAQKLLVALDSPVAARFAAAASDGKVYFADRSDVPRMTAAYALGGSTAFIFERTDKDSASLVLVSGDKYFECVNGEVTYGDFEGRLRCGVIKNGRLFGISKSDPFVLCWSGEGGWNDWTKGLSGSGSMRLMPPCGEGLEVFACGGELVVLCKKCIVRFSAGGNPEDFKVEDIIPVPEVVENSACVIGDGLLFFTVFGLMRYGGGKVVRQEGAITEEMQSLTHSMAYDNRYYFACGTPKGSSENRVYVYDTFKGLYQTVDVSAYFLARDTTSVLAYTSSYLFRITDEGTGSFSVEIPQFDFGIRGRKLFKTLEMDCDDDVTVEIFDGRHTSRYALLPKRKKLNIRGESFNIKISGKTGAVRSAYVTAEVPK